MFLQQLAVPSYAENGILFGPFYKGNEGTALYNASFRPFTSPVPFLFVRLGVVSDWKFFLDGNEEMLNLWARRYGESGAHALARRYGGCRGARDDPSPDASSHHPEPRQSEKADRKARLSGPFYCISLRVGPKLTVAIARC
jgi:hypothetical protein